MKGPSGEECCSIDFDVEQCYTLGNLVMLNIPTHELTFLAFIERYSGIFWGGIFHLKEHECDYLHGHNIICSIVLKWCLTISRMG